MPDELKDPRDFFKKPEGSGKTKTASDENPSEKETEKLLNGEVIKYEEGISIDYEEEIREDEIFSPVSLFLGKGLLLALLLFIIGGLIWSFVTRINITINGRFELRPSSESQLMFSPTDGYIKELFVDTGDYITIGTPLFSLIRRDGVSTQEYTITSNREGTVASIDGLSAGDYITVEDVLLRIYDQPTMDIAIIYIPTHQLGGVQPGQEVLLSLDAYPSSTYGVIEATLRRISPAPIEKEGMGSVIKLTAGDFRSNTLSPEQLKLGLKGDAKIVIDNIRVIQSLF